MYKIVILTNSLERGGKLESCLSTLFPTCQIVMQFAEMEGMETRKPTRETMGRNIEPT